jgi:tetratricopeptide (TPR) repeat protein
MRKAIASAAFAGLLVAGNLWAASGDDLFVRGRTAFRAGQYEQALPDLTAAADSYLADAQTEFGTETISAVLLDRYETSLVYLALANARLNHDAEALEAIVRIAASERIEPRFALLELGPDVATFPDLATRLAPGQLPVNNSLARIGLENAAAAAATASTQEDTSRPLPAVTPRMTPPPASEPVPMPEPIVVPAPLPLPPPAPEPVVVPMPAPQPLPSFPPAPVANVNGTESLQQAEDFAARGDVASASAVYERFLATPGASRETLIQVASGFYRIGAYDRARFAFDRLGDLHRGEEDLRYYKAVSLFETGAYFDARKELTCALPYIEVTTEVAHYSAMIDEMAHASAAPAISLE